MINDFNMQYTHTTAKEHENNTALSSDGAFKGTFYGSGTVDFASVADGDEAAADITVAGVALGDIVTGVSLGVDVVDATVTANVTAADTVTVVLANNTGGAVDLASTTVRVVGLRLV